MDRRSVLGISALTVLGLAQTSRQAAAQDKTLKQQLLGAWILSAVYDQSADGAKHDVWGAGVQGTLTFSQSGSFSLVMMAANRKPGAAGPLSPVGPAIAYIGSYTVDEDAKSFTYHIGACTFPQWNGADHLAKAVSVTADELEVVHGHVHDPKFGDVVPHLVWKRA